MKIFYINFKFRRPELPWFFGVKVVTKLSITSWGQHQQPQAAQQVQASQQFGGEQAKDEHHIKEHLDGKVDPTANMTPEQLQFHYFNMHDLDKNGKLDG
ncbi:unnamed protein product, partial [Cylicostephanus goldi]